MQSHSRKKLDVCVQQIRVDLAVCCVIGLALSPGPEVRVVAMASVPILRELALQ